MSTVEMDVLSNSQLVVFAILMLVGGELFGSMLGLQFRKEQVRQQSMTKSCAESVISNSPGIKDQFEMESSAAPELACIESGMVGSQSHAIDGEDLTNNAIKYLAYVVMGFLLLMHVGGFISVLVCIKVASKKCKRCVKGQGDWSCDVFLLRHCLFNLKRWIYSNE